MWEVLGWALESADEWGHGLCCWATPTSVQCGKCSTTSFSQSTNLALGPRWRVWLWFSGQWKLWKKDMIWLEWGFQKFKNWEWLSEVRARQLGNQSGSQGNLPGKILLYVKTYVVLSHWEQKGKPCEQRNRKYSASFWVKGHFSSASSHRPGCPVWL